jgi:hypothetical protein
MRGTILSAALLSAAALAGCYTTADVGYSTGPGYAAPAAAPPPDAYVAQPDMAEVSPGVQVVANYDEPVFYSEGFYWRYQDNYWYRSNNYASGFYFYASPPAVIVHIDRPYAYVHYRPAGYVARNPPRYRPAPVVRGRETTYRPAPAAQPGYRPAPAAQPGYRAGPAAEPVVRDHRETAAPAARPAPAPVVRDHRAPPPAAKKEEHH